jgi:alginate O-acetyltransferase complex protein AlgI
VVNYVLGSRMQRCEVETSRRLWLIAGLVANLFWLVQFKYAAFLVENLNGVLGTDWPVPPQTLPLGISFFTFQQIAFLCDVHQRRMVVPSPLKFGLFVTFFPQLIAGPIVRPDELLPQLWRPRQPGASDLAVGLTLFALGLFKKTVLADGVAGYASPLFAATAHGYSPTLLEAWGAALAYAFQLYFDFSGYSDMAIGSARLFGVRLPCNFDSPYQATSIGDFWRRWHMTLSRFLKEFVYIPLGGSRCPAWRRTMNLVDTMLLAGLWHGAGWTYVVWGGLHGVLLAVDHAWQQRCSGKATRVSWWARPVTFLAVVAGWVLFRAESLPTAGRLYAGLVGGNGVVLPEKWLHGPEPLRAAWSALAGCGINFERLPHFDGLQQIAVLAGLYAVTQWAPNSNAWLRRMEQWAEQEDAIPVARWGWSPSLAWGLGIGLLGATAILRMTAVSEFVYFQF